MAYLAPETLAEWQRLTLGASDTLTTSVRPDPMATAQWMETATSSPAPVEPIRIEEEIARGGMGTIHRGRQTALARTVAVKRVVDADPTAVAQFVAEAKITGLVEHANVVPVHTLDRDDHGQPQLAMKLIEGRTLEALIGEPANDRDERRVELLGILRSVCQAVAHAHERGFIHRDLKPANVMVSDFGQVYVLDWGLAVGLDAAFCEAEGLLHVEQVESPAGTPAYLAPELARGDGLAQGPWTDVYLLGGILHAILTGEPLHDGDTLGEALTMAIASPPLVYPDDVPAELATIANRATAASPKERFASVVELREALDHYLDHRAAHAIAAEGRSLLDELEGLIGEDDPDAYGQVQRRYGEAMFALTQAREMGGGDEEARRRCSEAMFGFAVSHHDLSLAERVATDDEGVDPDGALRERLRTRLAAREAELAALRDHARRLDWRRIGPALGRIFLAGGIAGPLTLVATSQILIAQPAHTLAINASIWTAMAAGVGLYALRQLRLAEVPRSLASRRVFGTWAAVGLACLATGLFNEWRPIQLSWDMGYPCLFMGVGYVAMALQTRTWLLAPAAVCYGGACAIVAAPSYGYALLGVTWALALGGTGIALLRGAPLMPLDAVEAPRSARVEDA